MQVAQSNTKLSDDHCWDAVVARDPARDGEFVFAVSTTGVYCRPSCPARRPRRKNVTFYSRPEQAETAGFRACLRCRPRALTATPLSDLPNHSPPSTYHPLTPPPTLHPPHS